MNRFASGQAEYRPVYFLSNWEEKERHSQNFFYALVKRGIDIVLALCFLVLFFPVYMLIFSLIMLFSSGFPIIKQERVGLNGKKFQLYKFKTMNGPVSYEYSPKSNSDQRVSKIGGFLRKSSLDEIPQFLNVLKGDMSIVGPRPEMEFIVRQYNNFERSRLKVKPGITGLWQIKADRKKLIHENIDFDLNYIKNRSLRLDFAIMAQTAMFMLKCINK